MNAEDIKRAITKAFRANTHKVKVIIGQFDQTKEVEQIEDIDELKEDIFAIIDKNYQKDKIDKSEIFVGTKKLGASYSIEEPIKIAKQWGFKYVAWNGGEIIKLNGDRTGLNYDEL